VRQRVLRLLAASVLLTIGSCSTHEASLALLPAPIDAGLEQEIYAAVNDYRAGKGLRPLAWSDAVAAQARAHSRKMASGATPFGHRDFGKRVAAIRRVMPANRVAENVARTFTVARAVELWLHHRGHRQNIEGRFDLTGVGAARASDGMLYFTQIFVKRE
jgi:uncharacterized protein YkwD